MFKNLSDLKINLIEEIDEDCEGYLGKCGQNGLRRL